MTRLSNNRKVGAYELRAKLWASGSEKAARRLRCYCDDNEDEKTTSVEEPPLDGGGRRDPPHSPIRIVKKLRLSGPGPRGSALALRHLERVRARSCNPAKRDEGGTVCRH